MIATLILIQELSKPEEVWKRAETKLGSVSQVRVLFETRDVVTKRLVYRGSYNFRRGKEIQFEYEDLVERCRAGADADSCWVSPADFRGYNDTVPQRQPYFIVSITRKADALDSPLAIDKPVKRVGFSEQIETTDGTKILIDSRKNLINQIEGQDTSHERIVTTFTYKKVI
ncbi:MAG TPA: hypothetical protein VK171_11005 [Fimbriimonas sp.]|nr:hypothetical protein [Fimbriimonas sp.]